MSIDQFRKSLDSADIITRLRKGLIGEGIEFATPFGRKNLIYADYTASGRALCQVEDFIQEQVLPYYANSHTEASHCGAVMTRMREEARTAIARITNAGDDCSVIFSGSGATSAINRTVALCGVAELADTARLGAVQNTPVVFIGPYEHHSNILPWRESGAEIIEIEEGPEGGPDLAALEEHLIACDRRPLKIGAFSAASNVTGIVSDVDSITRILKRHNALAFWDYAGGGPYLPLDMNPGTGLEKDAIFLSPHKFPGGPGASGLLIVRKSMVRAERPTWPGGGSVSYVSPWAHDYFDSLIEREEAGTPNVVGDIRAALVFLVKEAVGTEQILKRDKEFSDLALHVWQKNPKIKLLGTGFSERLPIFSFIVRDDCGGYVHHQLITKLLSDLTGVQARGGCVCAGPYGHRLLGVERSESESIRADVLAGDEFQKPGWVRLNFNYLMDEATVSHIINAVELVANHAIEYSDAYLRDETKGGFYHKANAATELAIDILPVHKLE